MIAKACVAQVGAVPFDVPASISKAEECSDTEELDTAVTDDS